MRRLPLAPAALAVCLAAPLAVPVARAQTTPRPARTTRNAAADSLRTYEAAPVVVTATRRATRLSDAPVPVSVVGRAEIAAQQPLRLSDLLADQPGLTVTTGLGGTGVQMQGLDPAYTLILVDGEPVVGRTAGVLDLERLTVAGVERVEIVRGPTSSRYGSDALAGVVNLITRVPGRGLRGEASARAETNATTDLTLQGEGGTERIGLRLLVNRYGSGGFDLDPDAAGQNGPRLDDVSAEARLSATPTDALDLDLTARAATQRQDNEIALTSGLFDDTGSRRELSLAPRARLRLRPSMLLDASASVARFATTTRLVSTETGIVTDDTDLAQSYGKAEATFTYVPSARSALYVGGGAIREGIGGDRYASDRHTWQGFGFAEATLRPSRRVDVNASARYDRHSDYAPSLTPKLAVLVRPSAWARLRASVGSGFKAPAFRQLYLDFTNTAAGGYSVYGASDVARKIAALQAQGGIAEILVDPATLGGIAAERSVAVSAGGEATRGRLSARVNVFRNDIRDLIETQQVAIKTNGQAVFSYANLARVTTQGIEAEASWQARIGAGPWMATALAAAREPAPERVLPVPRHRRPRRARPDRRGHALPHHRERRRAAGHARRLRRPAPAQPPQRHRAGRSARRVRRDGERARRPARTLRRPRGPQRQPRPRRPARIRRRLRPRRRHPRAPARRPAPARRRGGRGRGPRPRDALARRPQPPRPHRRRPPPDARRARRLRRPRGALLSTDAPPFTPSSPPHPLRTMRISLLPTLSAAALAATLALTGCDSASDAPTDTVAARRVTELPADPNTRLGPDGRPAGSTGHFTLYSLRTGAVVPNADSASTKWDVAFRGSTILANRTTGSQGGILVRVGAFADLTMAPDTTYGASVSGSQWYDYANNLITPKAGRVLAVRAADGAYAKLRLVSYYKGQTPTTDPTASRYYTFDYAIQTDGTRRFE